jgi:hypothetical protein
MTRHGVDHVNLAYFGQADPQYYGINCTYLPGSLGFESHPVERPRLPGYVAISPTLLNGVYLSPAWRLFYRPFRDRTPVAVIGNSIRVYWVDRWPEATGPDGWVADVNDHRSLADGLMFGYQWPRRAIRHYREYLRHRPDDARAWRSVGLALIASDETDDALRALERAVTIAPDDGDAHFLLGQVLFAAGDIAGSAVRADRAAKLLPARADVHDLLGRVRAVEGRFSEAQALFERALLLDPAHRYAREHLDALRRAQSASGPDAGPRR